jgi:hypothetical protein
MNQFGRVNLPTSNSVEKHINFGYFSTNLAKMDEVGQAKNPVTEFIKSTPAKHSSSSNAELR